MHRIRPQHEEFGLPHTGAALPLESEVADLLRPRPLVSAGLLNLANYDEDDSQQCENCGDRVYTLSNRGMCDGCEEEADHAGTHGYAPHPRPLHHD